MNLPDERSWSGSAPSEADDAHTESQQVLSARHAAEALFKPKDQRARIERPLPSTNTPSSEQRSQRAPRILMSSKVGPEPRPEPETPASAPDERQRAATTERAAKIPASEYRRVRTLATYGMTREQVAELYDASLSEVRRVIGKGEGRNDA